MIAEKNHLHSETNHHIDIGGGRHQGVGDADAMMDMNIPIKLPTHSMASHRHNHYNFTVGGCCIVEDAEPYLEEWLDYQLLALELDTVILYDNSNDLVLHHWFHNTRDHPVCHKVQVVPFSGGGRIQQKACTHCFEHFGKQQEVQVQAEEDAGGGHRKQHRK
jgi:hypothetical protein